MKTRPAPVVKLLGLGCFYLYLASLFGLGSFGLALPGPELERVYGLSFDAWTPEAEATLLHQYRILKAFVLGFAVFALVFRREIFRERSYNFVFLFTMLVETAVRPLSLVLDGRPTGSLVAVLFVELFFAVWIVAYSKATVWEAT